MEFEVRKAASEDVPGIVDLVAGYSERGQLLPRPLEEIASTLDDWVVAVWGDTVKACGSLVRYTPELSEVRSLAVSEKAKRNGKKQKGMTASITGALGGKTDASSRMADFEGQIECWSHGLRHQLARAFYLQAREPGRRDQGQLRTEDA